MVTTPEGPDTLQSRLLDKADLPWRIITNYPMFVGHGIAVQNATEVAHQEKNPDEIYGLYIGRAHEKALIARWEAIVELVNGLRDAASALEAQDKRTQELLRASERCTCGALGDLRVHNGKAASNG